MEQQNALLRWFKELRDKIRSINGNIAVRLGDAAGATRLSIRDSDGVEVAWIDSNGGSSLSSGSSIISAGHIVLQLGDAAGAFRVRVLDSGGVEVASINSDGAIAGTSAAVSGAVNAGSVAATGAVSAGSVAASNGFVESAGLSPLVAWRETDQAADERIWDVLANSKTWALRAVNDAYTDERTAVRITRGAGVALSKVEFPQTGIEVAGTVRSNDDVHPLGMNRGLGRRFIDTAFVTPTSHWRVAATLPAGYSWAGAPFSGGPGGHSAIGSLNDYLLVYALAGTRHFLYASPGSLLNDQMYARCGSGHNSSVGIRFDDGTDNNYYEGIWVDIGGGLQRWRIKYRTGGGAVAYVDGPTQMVGLQYTMMCWCYHHGGGTHQLYTYHAGEDGNTSIVIASPSATWTPSRVGLVFNEDGAGGPANCDWFAHHPVA